MIPKLYAVFPAIGNGLGGLSDAIECRVEHEVNGIYELSMRYPITGEHFDDISSGLIVVAKPDTLTTAQPFRIYRITKPLNGVVTVYARHICYDMMGTIVEPFSAGSLTAAIGDLANHCTPTTPFTFSTTRSVASPFSISEPKELWRVLGGSAGSFLDVYGGEWDFDFMTAELKTRLGTDRGVNIRYGKNMTALEQDATIESTYSGVWPYWYDEESGTLVQISEKYVPVTGAAVTDRILLLDCTADFESQPSEQELRDKANAYITANSVGDPKTSWRVSFVQLSQAGEYETQAALEQVMLGDTLHVYYEALGVNATARAVKIVFDVLGEKFIEITVGRVKQNLASIIVDQNKEVEKQIATTKSALEQAVDRSTDFIKNGAGYMRLIYDSNDQLVEIVSLDNPDISLAQNVWRWNNGGFGFSNTGYNGTYGLALTQAGEIVADYITTGTLTANVIRAGILQDTANKNSWNLQTGAFTITNGSINITTNSQTYDAISLTYNEWTASMAPLQFDLKNSSTKKEFLLQAGGIYGYSDYSTNKRDVLISADGSAWLGGGSNAGLLYLNNASANTTATLDGSTGKITLGGSTNGEIIVKNSSNANRIILTGSSGNITSVNHTLGSSSLGAGTMFVNNASNNSVIVLDGANAAITGQTLTLGGTMTGAGNIKINRADGTNGMEFNPSLPAMIIKAANGTGYRTALADDGLYFYNASGTWTSFYPSGGFAYYSGTAITSNVPSGTETNVRSVSLPAGRYIIWAKIAWPNNSTGRREACIGTYSGSVTAGAAWDFRNAVSGDGTRQSLSAYVTTSAQTTYYLVLYQNSGSTLAMSAYGLYAIKLP